MSDFLNANIPQRDLTKLNNCRLYLQVTTLAKITDHTGTKLLETNITTKNQNPDLITESSSQLQWQTQPSPGKTTWKLWTRTLQMLYTKPGMSTQLKISLGPWLPQATVYRKWHTTYNPISQAITKNAPVTPPVTYPMTHATRSHRYYSPIQINQAQHQTSYPITIEPQWQGFCVAQLIFPIPTNPIEPIEIPSLSLIINLCR